ncbi:hypothetical protein NMY22_g12096 [Coprinellus aureogranulatus]|nr:hypothetical protein NMY22_g12096 [Coprinellus aureogranulatus]
MQAISETGPGAGGSGGKGGGATLGKVSVKDKFVRFYDVFEEVVERHRVGRGLDSGSTGSLDSLAHPNVGLSFAVSSVVDFSSSLSVFRIGVTRRTAAYPTWIELGGRLASLYATDGVGGRNPAVGWAFIHTTACTRVAESVLSDEGLETERHVVEEEVVSLVVPSLRRFIAKAVAKSKGAQKCECSSLVYPSLIFLSLFLSFIAVSSLSCLLFGVAVPRSLDPGYRISFDSDHALILCLIDTSFAPGFLCHLCAFIYHASHSTPLFGDVKKTPEEIENEIRTLFA